MKPRTLGLISLVLFGVSAAVSAAPAAGGSASGSTSASPAAPSGSVPSPPASAGTRSEEAKSTCVEHMPPGKARPRVVEEVPSRGQSGHALEIVLVVDHGKGETVLPSGFQPQKDSPELAELERAGLYLPDPKGGAGPRIERKENGERATTRLSLSFVPLPKKPGRATIVVPPFPISVARASGDVIRVCTREHEVSIEDPIANVPNPTPKPNPPARIQREVWTLLKNAVFIGAIALAVGALVAFLVTLWMRRPKPLPPPPPRRPPWEIAFEELYDLRHAGLIAEARFAEHFDRVSDIVRKYLGARFGFDGLESTTREALFVLRRITPPLEPLDSIESFLRQADLVKFAKTVPNAEECELALTRAERIISATLPEARSLVAEAPFPEPEGSA